MHLETSPLFLASVLSVLSVCLVLSVLSCLSCLSLLGSGLSLRPSKASIATSQSVSQNWELRNIYHHHPESKKRKSSEATSGSIHPYDRYGNAVETRKTISTIAILWPVKAIFEKRAATVEVDSFVSPARTTKSVQF